MPDLTLDNLSKVPDSEYTSHSAIQLQLFEHVPHSILTVGTEGRFSGPPSPHHVTLSRRSSMSIGALKGPDYNVDTTQIGVPVVTPRKERPGHKRSLTGMSLTSLLCPIANRQAPTFPLKLGLNLKNGPLAMNQLGRKQSKPRLSMEKTHRPWPTVSFDILPIP
jgi:hypothetical protein